MLFIAFFSIDFNINLKKISQSLDYLFIHLLFLTVILMGKC